MNRRNSRLGTTAALAIGLLAVSACDSGLTDVNKNPNAPEDVPINNILFGGLWNVLSTSNQYGVFGEWTMLYNGQNWAQQVAQPVYNDEDTYIPRDGTNDETWNQMYFALKDLSVTKEMAVEDGDDNVWAVAEIMSVYGFMVLTDLFNSIPYSETFELTATGGNAFPAYDDQADIYPDLISRLVTAAGMLDDTAPVGFEAQDPIYHGDVNGWEMFANSLQLRLAMRMSNVMAGPAQTAFEAAWPGRIDNVDDEADVDWFVVYPAANPTYEAIVYSGRTGDFRMSASLIDRLVAFNDPRLPIYAEPAQSDNMYRGLINGRLPGDDYDPPLTSGDFSRIGSYFLESDTPSPLLSYAETLFLGAEAAAKGWDVGGATADQLYQDGITAAMEVLGVLPGDIATYLAQPEVDYNTGTYQGVDAIHVQKWIALFLAGPEAWSDLRRIGWDWETAGGTGTSLVPADNSVLGAGEFPSRLEYPPTEGLVNPDNFPDPAPSITDPVWWMN